jgi:hypothetical protein
MGHLGLDVACIIRVKNCNKDRVFNLVVRKAPIGVLAAFGMEYQVFLFDVLYSLLISL